MKLKKVK